MYITEPVGSKAPTFSAESKSYTFVKAVGQSFALLSNAQGFPVPLIRHVNCTRHSVAAITQ